MVDESGTPSGEDLVLGPMATATKPRPRALWGVLAVVAVAAGALAITSGGDSDGPPRLPVALGASGSREAGTMAADMSLAWITYVAGDGLPTLGGEAPAYLLDGSVDEGRVQDLAAALGFDDAAALTASGRSQDGLWHIQSDHGTLEVYEPGGGSWWFSTNVYAGQSTSGSSGSSSSGGGSSGCEPGPATDCSFTETGREVPATAIAGTDCTKGGPDCATTQTAIAECSPNADCAAPTTPPDSPCPPDAGCPPVPLEDCPEGSACPAPYPGVPTPPADLPSQDEARQIALDLLAATGMDVGDATVTLDGPYDAWYVTVELRLDGVAAAGWGASVGVGPKGAITNASGTLAVPERLGRYPLVDTRAAIDRLNALQGGGWMAVRDDIAVDSGSASASATDSVEELDTTAVCQPVGDGTDGTTAGCAQVPTTSTVVSACKVQPDGSEICEAQSSPPSAGCVTPRIVPGTDPAAQDAGCAAPDVCYDAAGPTAQEGASDTTVVDPGCVDPVPMPMPEPEPIEIALTRAEPVLTLMPALDGGAQAYLVPGYRFSSDDGTVVDVPAVADESLAPTTTAPADVTEPADPSGPGATSCDGLVDEGSGSIPADQPCPTQAGSDPGVTHLSDGEAPVVGVGYYVDVNTHCGWFTWAGRWWATDAQTPLPWSSPTEGGTFTLGSPDEGTFVGDVAGTKTATFTARGPAYQLPGCA